MKQANPEAYNKQVANGHPGHGTLVGNWHEEQSLRTLTGVGRTVPGSHVSKQRSTLYSGEWQPTASSATNNTFRRVFPDPKLDIPLTVNQEYGRFEDKTKNIRTLGPRGEYLEKQFLHQSQQEWTVKENEKPKSEYTTTYSTLHAHPGINPNSIGRHVLKDIDGVPVPVNRRDDDILVDNKLMPRPPINRDEELKQLVDFSKHYSNDVPFTFWAEKQNQGTFYNSKIADQAKGFHRNNDFVKQFHHYTHKRL